MANDIFSETIALAAIFQSAAQIQRVARKGEVDEAAIAPLMRAIVVTNPNTIEDIYEPKNLIPGLTQIMTSISPNDHDSPSNAELVKMAFSIVGLESNLDRQSTVSRDLSNEVDRLRDNVLLLHTDYLDADNRILLDYDIIKMYSNVYSTLISPNFPKLIVYGEEEYLRRTEFQEMIRALILSGIRASILWRQVGGKRYSLMFKYKDIMGCANKLIRENS